MQNRRGNASLDRLQDAAEESVETEAVEGEVYEVPEIDPELMAGVDGFLFNIPEGWLAMKEVDQLSAAIHAGATVIDVRETSECDEDHVPGAVNIPMRIVVTSATLAHHPLAE